MSDREKIIYDIERCICHVPDACRDCSKFAGVGNLKCMEDLMADALELLKEQEAVKPVRDRETCRLWLCGNCGSYVGFEDNDPYDQNEFDKFCRECGKAVQWHA